MTDIRPLKQEDLPDLADIHVRIWQETYAGQMPQDFLDRLDPAQRLKGWQEGFSKNKDNPEYGTFLARVMGKAAGFLSFGPARDQNAEMTHEIYAINILKEYWGQGIGWVMFCLAIDDFKKHGIDKTYLWVLTSNQNAIDAYLRWGGKLEKDVVKEIEIGGAALKEYRISFDLKHF